MFEIVFSVELVTNSKPTWFPLGFFYFCTECGFHVPHRRLFVSYFVSQKTKFLSDVAALCLLVWRRAPSFQRTTFQFSTAKVKIWMSNLRFVSLTFSFVNILDGFDEIVWIFNDLCVWFFKAPIHSYQKKRSVNDEASPLYHGDRLSTCHNTWLTTYLFCVKTENLLKNFRLV